MRNSKIISLLALIIAGSFGASSVAGPGESLNVTFSRAPGVAPELSLSINPSSENASSTMLKLSFEDGEDRLKYVVELPEGTMSATLFVDGKEEYTFTQSSLTESPLLAVILFGSAASVALERTLIDVFAEPLLQQFNSTNIGKIEASQKVCFQPDFEARLKNEHNKKLEELDTKSREIRNALTESHFGEFYVALPFPEKTVWNYFFARPNVVKGGIHPLKIANAEEIRVVHLHLEP